MKEALSKVQVKEAGSRLLMSGPTLIVVVALSIFLLINDFSTSQQNSGFATEETLRLMPLFKGALLFAVLLWVSITMALLRSRGGLIISLVSGVVLSTLVWFGAFVAIRELRWTQSSAMIAAAGTCLSISALIVCASANYWIRNNSASTSSE